jgi:succinate dehydrogenase / fumarate reductase cytochrome b subunit
MVVSILHRITGAGLSIVGLAVLTWWLMAIAAGDEAYSSFAGHAGKWYGLVVLVGLTWAFFQHLFSGIRHLLMDSGMGFELRANKAGSVATMVGSIAATALLWAWWMGVFK